MATRQWTYWANDARADRSNTDRLARTNGLLCRPFYNAAGRLIPRVQQLSEGDELLLVHNGTPVRWYRIERARKGRGIAESPVFELIPARSALGRELVAHHFRHDGVYAPHLTALRVKPLRKPLVQPAPHRSRNAIEPFVPFAE